MAFMDSDGVSKGPSFLRELKNKRRAELKELGLSQSDIADAMESFESRIEKTGASFLADHRRDLAQGGK